MSYRFVNVLRYSYICLYVIELAVTLTAVLRLLNTLKGGGWEKGVFLRGPWPRLQVVLILLHHQYAVRVLLLLWLIVYLTVCIYVTQIKSGTYYVCI